MADKTITDELRKQLWILDQKRGVAVSLVAKEMKWLNSRWRSLQEDGMDGLVRHAADEVGGIAHHAQAVHVLLAQIDSLNVAVETVVKIGSAAGMDVVEELRAYQGGDPVAITVNALGKAINARSV
jgi:hypothetical protein